MYIYVSFFFYIACPAICVFLDFYILWISYFVRCLLFIQLTKNNQTTTKRKKDNSKYQRFSPRRENPSLRGKKGKRERTGKWWGCVVL